MTVWRYRPTLTAIDWHADDLRRTGRRPAAAMFKRVDSPATERDPRSSIAGVTCARRQVAGAAEERKAPLPAGHPSVGGRHFAAFERAK